MKLRARVAVPLVLGMVAAALSVAVTSLAQSSPGLGQTAAPGPLAPRAAPRGVVTLSAPIVQPGRRTASSGKARLVGTIRFRPRHQGRKVVIQRRVGEGSWTRVAKKRQDKGGAVRFTGRATTRRGQPFSYRGVAVRWRRNPRVVSREASSAVWSDKFRDDFQRRRLGPNWTNRKVRSPSRKCSRVGSPLASSVRGGVLRLQVKLNRKRRHGRCRVHGQRYRYYLNGQVSTGHLGDAGAFTRGTMAARIKFAKRRGQHGGFWMQPLGGGDDRGTAAASGAEIDVVEFFGKGYAKGGLASFLYNYGVLDRRGAPKKIGDLAPSATRMLPRRDTWWTRYHVFSLEWTRRYYKFMVDGRTHFRTKRGVSGVPEYLILSQLSSDWELEQARRLGTRPGGTMKVDWVRVWQK